METTLVSLVVPLASPDPQAPPPLAPSNRRTWLSVPIHPPALASLPLATAELPVKLTTLETCRLSLAALYMCCQGGVFGPTAPGPSYWLMEVTLIQLGIY